MKIAVISDVHGNLVALNKALEVIESIKPNEIWFLGDCFGYFPEGIECYDVLLKTCFVFLMGNHEAMLLDELEYSKASGEVYRLEVIKQEIDPEKLISISSLPKSYESSRCGRNYFFATHGSPQEPLKGYIYPGEDLGLWKPDHSELSDDVISSTVLTANTHHPFISKFDWGTLVNVGSIGLPRDKGNSGSFALIDVTESGISHEIIRFEIPVLEIIDTYERLVHESVVATLMR